MAADLTRAALLFRSGPHRDFPLPETEATLGFGGGDVVRVPMEGVSRRHAKIFRDGNDYWIEDLGSSNGTFLNGVRLTKRERLKHLDVVTLGRSTDLIFVLRTREAARITRHGIKSASIEALDGGEAGSRWTIPRGSVTIGRAASNNVVVDSELVSKMHVRLECTGLQLVVTDLHSHNGTYVDGERIVEPRTLKEGEEFALAGARRFRVHIEEGSIETTGVGPLPLQSHSESSLPMDWKTRMEWTPEELASFERGRKGDTGLREAAPPAPAAKPIGAATPEAKQPAAAPKPHAAPSKAAEAKPAPAPAKPEVKPAATAARPEAKEPAAAPKPEEKPAPAAVKPVEAPPAAPAKPQVEPPPAAPTKPVEAPPSASEKLEVQPPVAVVPPVEDAREKVEPESPLPAQAAPPPAAIASELPKRSGVRISGEATRALVEDEKSKPRVYLEGEAETLPLPAGDHGVGRLPGISIRLDAHGVSRRHAIIHVSNAEVVVEDLGSYNGTFVNSERISAPRKVNPGDLIQFGDVGFRVRFPAQGKPGIEKKPQ
ncbi:MAG TPA: FHA domain-containing protein [Thermoanaerobaculia bacterium]|nr:FHA domain-containing protein [Thermoanaerobaculia bacterium]